jgi:hypothetical protein
MKVSEFNIPDMNITIFNHILIIPRIISPYTLQHLHMKFIHFTSSLALVHLCILFGLNLHNLQIYYNRYLTQTYQVLLIVTAWEYITWP